MISFLKKIASKSLDDKLYAKLKSLSGSTKALPDFIILGAQKSGTTSLYKYLSSHSQVIPPARKEIHFFDNNFHRGVNWYRSHFPQSLEKRLRGSITGEASPYYLYHPHAPRRIANVVPDVKLIILLRNPVDRAISHYWHEVNHCEAEDLAMMEAMKREEERLAAEKKSLENGNIDYSYAHQHYSYKDRGKYLDQICLYLKYFSREQIKITKSSVFFDDTQRAVDEIVDYLGLRREQIKDLEPSNTGSYRKRIDSTARDYLEDYFREHNLKLERELGINF